MSNMLDLTEVDQKWFFALLSYDIAWNITEVWNVNEVNFMTSISEKIVRKGIECIIPVVLIRNLRMAIIPTPSPLAEQIPLQWGLLWPLGLCC